MNFIKWNFDEWRGLSLMRSDKSSFYDDLHSFRVYGRNLKKSIMTRYEVWKMVNLKQSNFECNKMIKIQRLHYRNKHHRRKNEIKYMFREKMIKELRNELS